MSTITLLSLKAVFYLLFNILLTKFASQNDQYTNDKPKVIFSCALPVCQIYTIDSAQIEANICILQVL